MIFCSLAGHIEAPALNQDCYITSLKFLVSLKVYYEKHVFSGLYIYKLVLPEPTEQQKTQWLHFIFNNNVSSMLPVSLYVCANHFRSDCFSNEGQYKAGFASTLTHKMTHKIIGPTNTGPSNCARAIDKCRQALTVFTVAYEYDEVSWTLAN